MSNLDYIFVKWEDNGFGLFLTYDRFQIMNNFHFARNNAVTWGDFWMICDPQTQDFCSVFMQADDRAPGKGELLSEIDDEVFILSDPIFPIVQCAEESTSDIGRDFMRDFCIETLETEYGELINLYSIENINTLLAESKNLGISVEAVNAPFPFDFFIV